MVYIHAQARLVLEIQKFHQTDPAVEQKQGLANMWRSFPGLAVGETVACITAAMRICFGSADPFPGIFPI